jgi:hypothetical protein
MLRQGHQGMKRKEKESKKIKKQKYKKIYIELLFIGLILRTVLSILIQALSCDN